MPGDGERTRRAADRLRAALVAEIERAGGLRDPAWRRAFSEVPRHLFVPGFLRPVAPGTTLTQLRLSADDPDPRRRAAWLEACYSDTALVTHSSAAGPVSSSSQPSLMALMLEALDLRDGDRVLEIGTGTGYNAALLAHRLGEAAVVTVDLEEEVTGPARAHLAAAGLPGVRVETGDGARGVPDAAPFDAVLATCVVERVPRAWPAQTRPGRVVLTPFGSGLLRLRVGQNATAEGRFMDTAAHFVRLRGPGAGRHRALDGIPPLDPAEPVPDASPAEDAAIAAALTGGVEGAEEAFAFLVGLALPGMEVIGLKQEDGTWLQLAVADGSIAAFGPDGLLRAGPRDLFGELRRLYRRWHSWGRPDRPRFGLTTTPTRQWLWLDHPHAGPWQRDLPRPRG